MFQRIFKLLRRQPDVQLRYTGCIADPAVSKKLQERLAAAPRKDEPPLRLVKPYEPPVKPE
jgi:hypothetical protein